MRSSTEPTPWDAVTSRWLTLPNVLTLARLASVPVFVGLFAGGRERAAVILYAAVACTDFFDGYLARRMGSVSELGKVLDPLVDRIFIGALAVALVVTGELPPWLAGLIVLRDALIIGAFVVVNHLRPVRIEVNLVGKTATAALLLGLSVVALGRAGMPGAAAMRGTGLALVVAGAILYWVSGWMYGRAGGRTGSVPGPRQRVSKSTNRQDTEGSRR